MTEIVILCHAHVAKVVRVERVASCVSVATGGRKRCLGRAWALAAVGTCEKVGRGVSPFREKRPFGPRTAVAGAPILTREA